MSENKNTGTQEPPSGNEVACNDLLAKRNEVAALKAEKKSLSQKETAASTEYWNKTDEWREANNDLFIMENPELAKKIEESNQSEALWQSMKKNIRAEAEASGIVIPQHFLS